MGAPTILLESLGLRGELIQAVEDWTPKSRVGINVLRAIPHLPEDVALELIEAVRSAGIMESSLSLKVFRGLGLWHQGLIPWQEVVEENHGIVGRKVVNDLGAAFVVDAFQNSVELELMSEATPLVSPTHWSNCLPEAAVSAEILGTHPCW